MVRTNVISRKNKMKLKQYFMLLMVFMVTFSGMVPSTTPVLASGLEQTTSEEPEVSKDVDGESKREITKGEDYNYNVKVMLPEDISGYETMTILDDLDKYLAIQSTQILIDEKVDDTLIADVKDQKVELTLTQEELETLAGKEVQLQITTQINEEVENKTGIENVAEVILNDQFTFETNPVIVTLAESKVDEQSEPNDSTKKDDKSGKENDEIADKENEDSSNSKNSDISLAQVETSAEFDINNTDSYGISWEVPGVIYQFDGNNPSNTPKSSITVRGVAANKLLNGLALSKHNNHFYIASGTELFRIDPSGASLKVTDLLGPTGNGAMSVDGTEYYYSYGQDGKVFFASFDLVSRAHNSIEVSGLDSNVNSLGGDLLVDADGLIWFTQGNRLIQFDPTDGNVILDTELPTDDPNASGRGLSFLPDGRMLLAGGAENDSGPMLYIYDPELHEISYLGDMPGAVIVDLASSSTPGFDPPTPGELRLIKEDEEDGTRLAGATFELTDVDNNSVDELTTNEKGEAVLTDLEVGSYTLVETVAPTGYKLKDEAIDVKIENNKPTVVTIKNTKMTEPIDPPNACTSPVALINGSFEEPGISSHPDSHGGIWGTYPEGDVPGWKTTATDKMIELWTNGVDHIEEAAHGDQVAELNATQVGTLYQDVKTTPGQTIYWRLAHAGKYGPDTMHLKIGSPDVPVNQIPIIDEMTDTRHQWGYYKGEYVVPAGQTVTRFAFASVSATGGDATHGNILDDIFLGTEPCVTAEKSVTPEGEVFVGEELTYAVNVKNTGGDIAANMIFEDNIPVGTEFIPGSIKVDGEFVGDTHYDSDGNKIVIELGDLPNTNDLPEGIIVEFKVKTLSSHIGETVLNKAQIKYENLLANQNVEIETNEVENPIISVDPELDSSKSSKLETKADGNTDADNPEVGDTIRYTIQTKNTVEDSLIENLVITDSIPEGLTYVAGSLEVDGESVTDASDDDAGHVIDGQVTGNFGDITDTEDHTVTFLVTLDKGQAGKDIKNIATVDGDNIDPDEPEEEVKVYPREPKLESEKIAVNLEVGKEEFEVGDTIGYTIMARNTVSDSLVENLVITDELPEGLEYVEGSLKISHDGEGEYVDGTVTAAFGDVEDTEWHVVTFEAIIESGQSGETIENVANVEGDDVPPENPGTKIVVDPKDPKLTSTKSSTLETKADGNTDADNPEVGDTIRYTIQTKNTIEDSLIENLVITDELPEGLTYVAGSLEVDGKSVTDVEDEDAGHVIDGQVTGNFGNITDTKDHTLTFLVTVDEGQAGKDINNIAEVKGDNTDVDEPEEEVKVYPREPILESEKSAKNLEKGKDKFEVGDTVVYTIQTRNTVTDSLVKDLVITDELPEGLEYVEGSLKISHDGEGEYVDGTVTAAFGDVEDTEWHVVTFEAIIESGQSGETIENVANVEGDDVPPENPGTKIVVDPKDPKLTSTKSSTLETKADGNTDADNPEVGDTIRYTIQTKNTVADSLIENLVITDEIPKGLTYVPDSLEVDGKSVTDASDKDAGHFEKGKITGTFGNVTDTKDHSVTFLVTVDKGQTGKDIKNIAVAGGDNIDEPDKPEEEIIIYPREPKLESEKSAVNLDKDKKNYKVGDTVVYTIKARNTVSDSLVTNLSITDKLPAGLEYIEDSLEVSHESTGEFKDGMITADFGDVKDTEWRTITFQVKILSDQFGETIKNVATVDADNVTEPNRPEEKIVVDKKDSATPVPGKTEPPVDNDEKDVVKVPSTDKKEEGKSLPKTATNIFSFILIGMMALFVGLVTLRKRKSSAK